jgi:hypothetical protein
MGDVDIELVERIAAEVSEILLHLHFDIVPREVGAKLVAIIRSAHLAATGASRILLFIPTSSAAGKAAVMTTTPSAPVYGRAAVSVCRRSGPLKRSARSTFIICRRRTGAPIFAASPRQVSRAPCSRRTSDAPLSKKSGAFESLAAFISNAHHVAADAALLHVRQTPPASCGRRRGPA